MPTLSTFARPFFRGTSRISSEIPARFDVALDGVGYMVDWRKFGRRIVPPIAEQRDQSQIEPGEASLSTEGFFLRSRSDWSLGAGQRHVDKTASLEARFWRSRGVDVFTENQACMLNDTELVSASSDTRQWALTIGSYFYLIDETTVKWTQDPHAESVTWTPVTGITGSITDVTTDGNRIFIARFLAEVMEHDVGSTTAADFGSLTPLAVQYANGRLIGMSGQSIYEILNDGTRGNGDADIWTHPRTGASWRIAVSTPIGIFAALDLSSNNNVVLYHITADDSGASLSTPTFAGELPRGEQIHSLERYNRVLLIGTNRGIRFAEYGNNNQAVGTLDIGRSTRIHGDYGNVDSGEERAVQCFDAEGEFVSFGWSDFGGSRSGLGKMDLSRTVIDSEIVPPYASDLMTDDASQITGDVVSVARFAGKKLFCVAGSGLWREIDEKVPDAWLEPGIVTFGLTYEKAVSNLRFGTNVDSQPTTSGKIAMTLTAEDGDTVTVGPQDTAQASNASLSAELSGRELAMRIDFIRSGIDSTTGPCLSHWSMEAFPLTSVSYEFILPVIAHSTVKDLHGNQHPQSPLEMISRFESMAEGRPTIALQLFRRTHVCRVRDIQIIPGDSPSTPDHRAHDRGYLNTTISLRLITRPIVSV